MNTRLVHVDNGGLGRDIALFLPWALMLAMVVIVFLVVGYLIKRRRGNV